LVIKGSSLLGGAAKIASASLAGSEVDQIVSSSNTQVLVVAGANTSATEGVIRLVADSGAQITSVASVKFTYLDAGRINAVTPPKGQHGTQVTITGVGLRGGGTEVNAVTLAGQSATILSESDTSVIVSAGANTPGTGHVVVTSVTGAVTSLEGAFEYVAIGEIALLSPNRGQLGTYVAIHGTALLGAGSKPLSVKLGGIAAEVVSYSGTLIKLRASGTTTIGVGDVEIVSDSGSIVATSNIWTYDTPSNITAVCV
jgi:hypothetical protein